MAKQIGHPPSYTLLLLSFILLVSTEMPQEEAKVCQRRSKTWSGICANSNNCNCQCQNWEGAKHGACHRQYLGFACFCYFNC